MYVYDCNYILTAAMKNRSYKVIIRAFAKFTTDFKSRRIDPVFHFIDNKSSTELKIVMTTMDVNYQLVYPSNHRANNTDR